MIAMRRSFPLIALAAVMIACGSGGQPGPSSEAGDSSTSKAFSATAASAVRVDLTWAPFSGATGYLLEARYGSGDFFEAAKLSGNEIRYPHFVVPNTKEISYRLTALTPSGSQEVGSTSVSLPELSPDPVVISEVQPFLPDVLGGGVDISAMPTLDAANPDPNALATLMAMTEGMANQDPEELLADLEPISVTQVIGPEGGTVEVEDPNGVAYRLEIPAGLVETDTEFRLDPYEKLGNLPFSQLFAAARIFPPIGFNVPLRLTVALPEAPASEKVVAFDVSHFDGVLSMAPFYQDGNMFAMNVYWGDVVGFAGGSVDEVLAQASRIPTDAAAQTSQQFAVMQGLNDDRSPEAFAGIFSQILEGLIQVSGETSYRPGAGTGRLAAPTMRQQDGLRGFEIWQRFDSINRAWSEGTKLWVNPYDPWAVREDRLSSVAEAIGKLAGEIKQFLDTHTGCRTGDGFYAQAFRRILRSPLNDFEERLAEGYASQFGSPREKGCSYRLHLVTSTIVLDHATSKTTLSVHVNPFNMTVRGYGSSVFLEGGGEIAYDQMSQVIKVCGPVPVTLKPPLSAFFWVSELRPIFGAQDKVEDFYLKGVEPSGSGSSMKGVRAITGDECPDPATFSKPSPDLWGGAYVGYRNQQTGRGSWEIAGESSYVATYKESFSTSSSGFNVSVDLTMVLTVNEEGK